MFARSSVFVNLLSLLSLAGTVLAQPRMTLPVTSMNFGYAPQNGKISCRFRLYSSGQDTLRITNVRTSCGCTQAPLDKKVVPPGDSTEVEVVFNTGQYSGKVTKTAYIATNTGEPEKQVTITAEVLTHADSTFPVIIKPCILDLIQSREKNHREMKFSIQNVSAAELVPQMVAFPGEMFDVRLPKRIKPGESAEGVVKLSPSGEAAGFTKSFTFALNDERRSTFTVPVVGSAPLSSSPKAEH